MQTTRRCPRTRLFVRRSWRRAEQAALQVRPRTLATDGHPQRRPPAPRFRLGAHHLVRPHPCSWRKRALRGRAPGGHAGERLEAQRRVAMAEGSEAPCGRVTAIRAKGAQTAGGAARRRRYHALAGTQRARRDRSRSTDADHHATCPSSVSARRARPPLPPPPPAAASSLCLTPPRAQGDLTERLTAQADSFIEIEHIRPRSRGRVRAFTTWRWRRRPMASTLPTGARRCRSSRDARAK